MLIIVIITTIIVKIDNHYTVDNTRDSKIDID